MPYPEREPELIDILFEIAFLELLVIVLVYDGANYIYKKIARLVCGLKSH